jgi:hypothetical protein
MPDSNEQQQTLDEQIQYHLTEFIKLKLANTHCGNEKQNQFWEEARKFPPMPFVDQKTFGVLLTLQIERLETKGVIRRKRMLDGSIRVYEVIEYCLPCCGTVEQWKQCPENDCVLNVDMERCPHFSSIINPSYSHPIIIGTVTDQTTIKQLKENSQNE